VPLAALAFESPLVAVGAVVGLEAMTFLEYPLFLPWAYFYGGSAVWLAWSATLGRYVILAWLAFTVLRAEASFGALMGRVRHLAARLRRPALVGVAASMPFLLGAGPATQATPVCGPTHLASAQIGSVMDGDWSVPSGWFFTQAGEQPDHGYSIADDDGAEMWSEFNRLGGWRVLGYPASRRFLWHGMLSQATQREVLQWSPVTGQVAFADVLDLMHDQGRDDDLRRLKQIPPPLDVDEAGLPYETIATRRLAWLDSRPAIKASYCNAPRGVDPLELWGLPMSQAVNMSDSGGEVTVVLAGDLAKEFKLLPTEAVIPEPSQKSDF